MHPKISVIITTYNRPNALTAVLRAFSNQTLKDFEVIVADDGSKIETAKTILNLQRDLHYPLHHIWHADQGFRAATIRNKAAAYAKAEYLVFLDGDCIPRPTFLTNHQTLAEKNYFVVGHRVLLNQSFTEKILHLQLPVQKWKNKDWFIAWLKQSCNKCLPFLSIPLGPLRKITPQKWQGAKSCNLGIWKKDFIAVNGFDESYTGWGYEDSDLIIRLIRNEIKRKEGRFVVPVIHLWHSENDRSNEQQNYDQLMELLNSNHIQAKIGLNQYLDFATIQG